MDKFFTFHQSKIWEGNPDQIDPFGKNKTVKAKDEQRARRKLPIETGRSWILTGTKEN